MDLHQYKEESMLLRVLKKISLSIVSMTKGYIESPRPFAIELHTLMSPNTNYSFKTGKVLP